LVLLPSPSELEERVFIKNAISVEKEEKLSQKKTYGKVLGPPKFIDFCEYLSPQISKEEADSIRFRTLSDVRSQGLYTEAVDDTDVRVHCTDKKSADEIIKDGEIRGNFITHVSLTNKFGNFKGHSCNQGADVCFVFKKEDIDAQPIIYKWDSQHFKAAKAVALGNCPVDGFANKDECDAELYHLEKGCNKLLTKKEAIARAKEQKRDLDEIEQSALFVYENEFRTRKRNLKLPEKYELVPNSCRLEIKPLASFDILIRKDGKVVGVA